MAETNTITRKLIQNKRYFANIINEELFQGAQVINLRLVTRYDALSYTEQIEEIRRHYEETGESMTGTEFLSHMKREDKLIPVVTIVMYYGTEPWDAALICMG